MPRAAPHACPALPQVLWSELSNPMKPPHSKRVRPSAVYGGSPANMLSALEAWCLKRLLQHGGVSQGRHKYVLPVISQKLPRDFKYDGGGDTIKQPNV